MENKRKNPGHGTNPQQSKYLLLNYMNVIIKSYVINKIVYGSENHKLEILYSYWKEELTTQMNYHFLLKSITERTCWWINERLYNKYLN